MVSPTFPPRVARKPSWFLTATLLLPFLTGCVTWSIALSGKTSKLPPEACLSGVLRKSGWDTPGVLMARPGDWSLSRAGFEREPDMWVMHFSRTDVTGSVTFIQQSKGLSVVASIDGPSEPTAADAATWKKRLKELYVATGESCGTDWGPPAWTGCRHADCKRPPP